MTAHSSRPTHTKPKLYISVPPPTHTPHIPSTHRVRVYVLCGKMKKWQRLNQQPHEQLCLCACTPEQTSLYNSPSLFFVEKWEKIGYGHQRDVESICLCVASFSGKQPRRRLVEGRARGNFNESPSLLLVASLRRSYHQKTRTTLNEAKDFMERHEEERGGGGGHDKQAHASRNQQTLPTWLNIDLKHWED